MSEDIVNVRFKPTEKVGGQLPVRLHKYLKDKRAYSPGGVPVDIYAWVIYVGTTRFSGREFESPEDATTYAANYGFVITPGEPDMTGSETTAPKESDDWFEDGTESVPAQIVASSPHCTSCGRKLNPAWKFCAGCGSVVNE